MYPTLSSCKPLQTTMKAFEHSKTSISNQIFFYLISNQKNELDEEVLKQFQDLNIQHSLQWIQSGKDAGNIPHELQADKTSAFFVVLGYGMRVQAMINDEEPLINSEEIFEVMKHLLSHPTLYSKD